jgi:hypothetical protein
MAEGFRSAQSACGGSLNKDLPLNPVTIEPVIKISLTLAQVYALTLHSDEHIDLAIKFGDREGVCDDALRKQIHRLFGLAIPPQPQTAT